MLCMLPIVKLLLPCTVGFYVSFLQSIRFGIIPIQTTISVEISAAMFDWQAEMTTLAAATKVAKAVTSPLPSASPVVTFAQALTTSTRAASNENLFQPTISGETIGIKITQVYMNVGWMYARLIYGDALF